LRRKPGKETPGEHWGRGSPIGTALPPQKKTKRGGGSSRQRQKEPVAPANVEREDERKGILKGGG